LDTPLLLIVMADDLRSCICGFLLIIRLVSLILQLLLPLLQYLALLLQLLLLEGLQLVPLRLLLLNLKVHGRPGDRSEQQRWFGASAGGFNGFESACRCHYCGVDLPKGSPFLCLLPGLLLLLCCQQLLVCTLHRLLPLFAYDGHISVCNQLLPWPWHGLQQTEQHRRCDHKRGSPLRFLASQQ
jgi:hypothetical protein